MKAEELKKEIEHLLEEQARLYTIFEKRLRKLMRERCFRFADELKQQKAKHNEFIEKLKDELYKEYIKDDEFTNPHHIIDKLNKEMFENEA